MKVKIEYVGFQRKGDVLEVGENKTYSDLLEELGINPETVVLVRNGLPVPVDDKVEEGELEVIRVISGG